MFRRLVVPVVGVLLSFATAVWGQSAPVNLDAAFRTYWAASGGPAAERAAQQIGTSGASFDEVVRRLKAGRVYVAEPTGVRELTTAFSGITLDNTLTVPVNYDPARRWPLRVQLHGGVSRPAPGPGTPAGRGLTNNRIPSDGHLVLQPRGFEGVEWWKAKGIENILTLVARVKRSYNVDESHIYITGISDGGTGVYYLGMRAATLWSACLPLNGHPLVLANENTGVDDQLYMGNLANCPVQAVNGGQDQLYPASSVQPFVEMMKRAGVDLTWHVYPNAGHETSWWPQERPSFEQFVAAHPRPTYPSKISWETDRADRGNRYSWLVISALGKRPTDVAVEDVNTFTPGLQRVYELYDRRRPSGRVDAERTGNRFSLKTRGVRELTLLLHAEEIDFNQDVEVTVNGKTAFRGRVTRDLATLMTWAARDDDRTALYAAALEIAVP